MRLAGTPLLRPVDPFQGTICAIDSLFEYDRPREKLSAQIAPRIVQPHGLAVNIDPTPLRCAESLGGGCHSTTRGRLCDEELAKCIVQNGRAWWPVCAAQDGPAATTVN